MSRVFVCLKEPKISFTQHNPRDLGIFVLMPPEIPGSQERRVQQETQHEDDGNVATGIIDQAAKHRGFFILGGDSVVRENSDIL